MTKTLSSTYASLYTLSGAADNPATITATGLLDAGLHAASLGSAWKITNSGRVLGTGITLSSAGSVTNQSVGTITGGDFGVYVAAGPGTVINAGSIAATGTTGIGVGLVSGGSVTNAASASITGYEDAIATGNTGTAIVVNFGSIGNTGTAGVGVRLHDGGSVTNALSASILGSSYGIFVRGVGTLVNSGSIAGTVNSTGTTGRGVQLDSGGSITNGVSASITGIFRGAEIAYGAGVVVNKGGITSTGASGNGVEIGLGGGVGTVINFGSIASTGSSGLGVILESGGSVSNAASASIMGGSYGVLVHGVGTLVNSGNIAGTVNSSGTTGRGVQLDSGGSITNAVSASIMGIFRGAEISGAAGVVVNKGSIASTGPTDGNGVQIGLNGGVGTIVNFGSIASTGSSGIGVILESGGSVANYGRITGTGANGDGVDLSSGGSVTNAASASITGSSYGVLIHTGTGTLVNNGRIAGTINSTGTTGRGVQLDLGGSVTNGVSGSITGVYRGAEISGGAGVVINKGGITSTGTGGNGVEIGYGGGIGTVINSGSIASTFDAAVRLESGGSATNTSSASITGGLRGVRIYGAAGTVDNSGKIVGTISSAGTYGFGVELEAGGSVTNAASGSIKGSTLGVYLSAGGTLTNAGTIIGNSGTAVVFGGTTSNLLALDPGFGFSGLVTGSSSASNTLELTGKGSGILDELGTTFINFGTVIVDVGATWTVKALSSALAGVALIGNGTASTLTLTTPGTFSLGGISKFATIDLATGNSTVTVTDATLSGDPVTIHDGASGKNSISAAGDTGASKGKSLTYFAGPGPDSFTGGFENDAVRASAAAVGGDTLTGGSGTNTLTLTTAGSAKLGGVSKFATISLAAGNTTVTVTDATLSGGTVTINDGASGNNTISAAGDTAASTGKTLIYATGTGKGSFTGGFENDTVRASATTVGGDVLTGGSGTNTLTLTTAGTFSLGGVNKFATINLAAGNNTVSLTNKTLAIGSITIKDGASGNNNVSATADTAASKTKTLNYTTGSGTDSFTGGFENDVVRVSAAAVGGDTLTGSGGTNVLTLTSAGSANLGGVSKFATITLAAGTSTVTVTDKTLSGGTVTISDGASGSNAITAAGDTSASTGKSLIFNAGTGVDHFTGGFENDTVLVSAAAVGGDTLTGGSGINTLMLTSAGTFSLGGVSKFATINLAAGTNTVTVTDKTLTASITLKAGASGNNSISAAGDTAASKTKTLTYSTGSGTDSFTGGFENDTIVTASTALNAVDSINGGSGTNTMMLSGGGVFNLGALKALTKIQTVDAAEGQAPGGGVPSGVQIVDLRAGLDLTVNVASGTPNPLDPNPEVITINGAANKDVINLGAGKDTVVIGGIGETVNSGGGTALVSATTAFAGALVNGGSGTTTLKITTGGTATLNASDSKLTVDLTLATNLTLSKMSFVTAIGSTGNDTITALAQGQTLTGGGGKDTLNGFSGFGDVFSDTSAHLNTTTIGNFGGSDLIDLTDIDPNTIHPLTFNTATETLTATDGTHTANIKFIGSYTLSNFQIGGSDGHTGSLIKFV